MYTFDGMVFMVILFFLFHLFDGAMHIKLIAISCIVTNECKITNCCIPLNKLILYYLIFIETFYLIRLSNIFVCKPHSIYRCIENSVICLFREMKQLIRFHWKLNWCIPWASINAWPLRIRRCSTTNDQPIK